MNQTKESDSHVYVLYVIDGFASLYLFINSLKCVHEIVRVSIFAVLSHKLGIFIIFSTPKDWEPSWMSRWKPKVKEDWIASSAREGSTAAMNSQS